MPQLKSSLFYIALLQGLRGFIWYGIQVMVSIYLLKYFHLPLREVYIIYGCLMIMGYATPLVGGILIDYLCGSEAILVLSFLLMMLGFGAMAVDTELGFRFGVSLILLGVGFLKSSAGTVLACFYETHSDSQRDKAFGGMYFSVNIGAILAPIALGVFVDKNAWNVIFAISGLLSMIGFIFALHLLKEEVYSRKVLTGFLISLLLASFSAVFLIWPIAFSFVLMILAFVICIYVLRSIVKNYRSYLSAVLFLFMLNFVTMLYLAGDLQVGASLSILAFTHLHYSIGTVSIPPMFYNALLPLFVVLGLWVYLPLVSLLKRYPFSVSVLYRMGFAMLCCAFAFLAFAKVAAIMEVRQSADLIVWVVVGYFFLGCGELIISSTVLSATAVLAPVNLRGTFMGIFYLFDVLSGYFSGLIAMMTTVSLPYFHNGVAGTYLIISVFSFLILFPLWILKKYLNGVSS